ncbi:MAG: hypothetical protein ACLGIA_12040 [Actinomycetes bacterium]
MSIPAQARSAASRAATRGLERLSPPRLRVVTPQPARRSRLPFVIGCIALLVSSLIGLLVLNISLSRGAYQVHDLQVKAARLQEREQALAEELAYRAAPAQLSAQARALGMVPGGAPAFLRLSDGALLGSPQPAPQSSAPTAIVGLPPVSSDSSTEGPQAVDGENAPAAPRTSEPVVPPASQTTGDGGEPAPSSQRGTPEVSSRRGTPEVSSRDGRPAVPSQGGKPTVPSQGGKPPAPPTGDGAAPVP